MFVLFVSSTFFVCSFFVPFVLSEPTPFLPSLLSLLPSLPPSDQRASKFLWIHLGLLRFTHKNTRGAYPYLLVGWDNHGITQILKSKTNMRASLAALRRFLNDTYKKP
jgi:hypothetical protein